MKSYSDQIPYYRMQVLSRNEMPAQVSHEIYPTFSLGTFEMIDFILDAFGSWEPAADASMHRDNVEILREID